MKKNVMIIGAFMFSSLAFSQVSINNTSPAATLDITAKNAAGTATSVDGLLIPRVDRQRAQSMTGIPTSTLIYVNSIATGTTGGNAVNIDAVGYYYYNGTVWTKLNSSAGNLNIYNSDGTLQDNRIVTQADKTLAFTATASNAFSVDDGTFSVDAAYDRVGIGTITPVETLDVDGAITYRRAALTDKTSAGTIDYGSDGTRILSWGPNATTNGTLGFWTGFGGAGTGERMRIHSNGNVGIATANPAATLDVVGSPTVASSLDGVIPPRVTGNQLRAKTYTASQTGAMVYVTAADSSPTGQTINVKSPGSYYFDGTVWVGLVAKNLPTSQLILLVRGTGTQFNTASTGGFKLAYFSNSAVQGGFTDVINDPGSWNPSTQTYTAPVAGTYQIAMTVLMGNCNVTDGSKGFIRTLRNGSTINTADLIQSNGLFNSNQFTTISLQAGDKISVDYSPDYGGGKYCTLSGDQIQRLSIYRFQ